MNCLPSHSALKYSIALYLQLCPPLFGNALKNLFSTPVTSKGGLQNGQNISPFLCIVLLYSLISIYPSLYLAIVKLFSCVYLHIGYFYICSFLEL